MESKDLEKIVNNLKDSYQKIKFTDIGVYASLAAIAAGPLLPHGELLMIAGLSTGVVGLVYTYNKILDNDV